MAKVKIYSDGLDGFRGRVLEHARALDRGESLPGETTLSFESPQTMFRVLSPKRLVLLQTLTTKGSQPVDDLARNLGRTGSSVSRDVSILRRLGVVNTMHSKGQKAKGMTIVGAAASRFTFVSSISK